MRTRLRRRRRVERFSALFSGLLLSCSPSAESKRLDRDVQIEHEPRSCRCARGLADIGLEGRRVIGLVNRSSASHSPYMYEYAFRKMSPAPAKRPNGITRPAARS